MLKAEGLKELYEKDFYRWVYENLELLKRGEHSLITSWKRWSIWQELAAGKPPEPACGIQPAWRYALKRLRDWLIKNGYNVFSAFEQKIYDPKLSNII